MAGDSPLEIDVWSDLVCPWCYLGKRRLAHALASVSRPVIVRWHAFQLDPGAPRRVDVSVSELLQRKYGMARAQVEATQRRLVALGREVGIDYRFDLAQTGNTRDAHRLVAFAAHQGRGDDMVEALMRAYFTDGVAVGDGDALVDVAMRLGFAEAELRAALCDASTSQAVDTDLAAAREIGVTGVPFFILGGRDALSGAQPVAVLENAIERAARG